MNLKSIVAAVSVAVNIVEKIKSLPFKTDGFNSNNPGLSNSFLNACVKENIVEDYIYIFIDVLGSIFVPEIGNISKGVIHMSMCLKLTKCQLCMASAMQTIQSHVENGMTYFILSIT